MFDIIILAVVVAALVYQLRRVLGERNGAEPTPGPDPLAGAASNVVGLNRAMNAKPVEVKILPDGVPASTEPLSVNQGLQQIKDYDADFDERAFLQGARAAFEMIVKGYARGDMETLKTLLAPNLADRFAEDIKTRKEKGQVMETTLFRIASAILTSARMIGFDAEIGVEFVSEQTSVIRDATGNVMTGDANAREEVRDTWIFRRDTRGQDPVWHLVETHA